MDSSDTIANKVLVPRYTVSVVYDKLWPKAEVSYVLSDNLDDVAMASHILASWLWAMLGDMREWVMEVAKWLSKEDTQEIQKLFNDDVKRVIDIVHQTMFIKKEVR